MTSFSRNCVRVQDLRCDRSRGLSRTWENPPRVALSFRRVACRLLTGTGRKWKETEHGVRNDSGFMIYTTNFSEWWNRPLSPSADTHFSKIPRPETLYMAIVLLELPEEHLRTLAANCNIEIAPPRYLCTFIGDEPVTNSRTGFFFPHKNLPHSYGRLGKKFSGVKHALFYTHIICDRKFELRKRTPYI